MRLGYFPLNATRFLTLSAVEFYPAGHARPNLQIASAQFDEHWKSGGITHCPFDQRTQTNDDSFERIVRKGF